MDYDVSNNENKVNCCCIANVKGICSVKECEGEIRRFTDCKMSLDEAAIRYNIAKKSFEDYFSEVYKDTDTEE